MSETPEPGETISAGTAADLVQSVINTAEMSLNGDELQKLGAVRDHLDARAEDADDTGDVPDFQTTRLTDMANVVALDGSAYPDELVQEIGTYTTDLLRDQLDIVETLGWDGVSAFAVQPYDDSDHPPALAFVPGGTSLSGHEQAAVVLAPRTSGGSDE